MKRSTGTKGSYGGIVDMEEPARRKSTGARWQMSFVGVTSR